MRKTWPGPVLLAASLFAGQAVAQTNIDQLADQFEAAFRAQVADRSYPGAAFAIVNRAGVVRLVAMGHTDAAGSAPVNADTVFRMASVSKTFAAGTLAILEQEGHLEWDDPVVQYVPDFSIDGDTSRIRIHHLLEHSSGIVPHAYDNLIEDGLSYERILGKMDELPYICQPGNCYGYQNFLFSLLEPAAEKSTATPYSDLVSRRIFKPLDMRTASVGYQDYINNPNHAKPHIRSRGGWKTVRVEPNYYTVAPAAGVNASITDVAKWLRAQLGSHPQVISAQMVEQLTQPKLRTYREMYRKHWKDILTNAHYGMGWRVYQLGEEQIVYHGGWVRGFRADIAFSPNLDLGVAVLLNIEGNSISELTAGFWKMALAP